MSSTSGIRRLHALPRTDLLRLAAYLAAVGAIFLITLTTNPNPLTLLSPLDTAPLPDAAPLVATAK